MRVMRASAGMAKRAAIAIETKQLLICPPSPFCIVPARCQSYTAMALFKREAIPYQWIKGLSWENGLPLITIKQLLQYASPQPNQSIMKKPNPQVGLSCTSHCLRAAGKLPRLRVHLHFFAHFNVERRLDLKSRLKTRQLGYRAAGIAARARFRVAHRQFHLFRQLQPNGIAIKFL